MVQIYSMGQSARGRLAEQLGNAIGGGLANFGGNYLANKELQNVLNDPSMDDKSPSERQQILQTKLAKYGEFGQRVMQRQMEIEQKGAGERALKKLKNLDMTGKSPYEQFTSVAEALQGHPQGNQLLQQVLPYIRQQAGGNAVYGGPGGAGNAVYGGGAQGGAQKPQGAPQQSPAGAPTPSPAMAQQAAQGGATQATPAVPSTNPTPQQPMPMMPSPQVQAAASPGGVSQVQNQNAPAPQPASAGGQLGQQDVMSAGIFPEEYANQQANRVFAETGDMQLAEATRDIYKKRNEQKIAERNEKLAEQVAETGRQADVLARDKQLRKVAEDRLKIKNRDGTSSEPDQEEVNDFMELGKKYRNLDPTQWYEKTRQDFDQFMRVKTQFDDAFVPGALRGLVLGGEERERDMKRLEPQVKSMLKYGKESYVRNKLMEQGATQTEVEKLINPLSQETKMSLNKLPKGLVPPQNSLAKLVMRNESAGHAIAPRINQVETNRLSDYLLDNLGDNSLLALRDDVINKKHYGWDQYQSALQDAMERGLELNPTQEGELNEVANPPRESLANIFRGVGNVLQWMSGAK